MRKVLKFQLTKPIPPVHGVRLIPGMVSQQKYPDLEFYFLNGSVWAEKEGLEPVAIQNTTSIELEGGGKSLRGQKSVDDVFEAIQETNKLIGGLISALSTDPEPKKVTKKKATKKATGGRSSQAPAS